MKGPQAVTEALSTSGETVNGPPAGNKTMKGPPAGTEALSTSNSVMESILVLIVPAPGTDHGRFDHVSTQGILCDSVSSLQ